MKRARGLYATTALMLVGGIISVGVADESSTGPSSSEATITRAEAEKVALERVPGGTIKEAELEHENGRLVWSFDVAVPDSSEVKDVEVDARTGEFVKEEADD